jgi:Trypsin-like peptidase domain
MRLVNYLRAQSMQLSKIAKTIVYCLLPLFALSFFTACTREPSIEDSLVRIEVRDVRDEENWLFMGSGVLIKKAQESAGNNFNSKPRNIYHVVTASHVLPLPNDFRVVTHDSSSYELSSLTIVKSPDVKCSDIAVFKFESNSNYEVAKINQYQSAVGVNSVVQMDGWFIPKGSSYSDLGLANSVRQSTQGELIDTKLNEKGCSQLHYKKTLGDIPGQGTSGAPIFNDNFEVVGIHIGRNPRNMLLGTPIQCLNSLTGRLGENQLHEFVASEGNVKCL